MIAVDFMESDLTEALFDNCNLRHAVFIGTTANKTDFTTSYDFTIDPEKNKLKRAIFSTENLAGLLQKYDLVILDELGYISFDREGSEILFNLLSNRNEQGSIIITTNLIFERWEEIFKDPILTGAVVDRLAHKAHILNLSGESYRIKETKKLFEK